jgi:hypothetical protein
MGNSDATEYFMRNTVFRDTMPCTLSSLKPQFLISLPTTWAPGFQTPPHYGLPKIHKQGAPLLLGKTPDRPTGVSYWPLFSSHKELDIACTLGSLCTRPQDIMVSFDEASFFTRVPIMETMSLLSQHFEDILRPSCYVLTSYVSFTGQFYEQSEGIAMCSLPFIVIANFFMEDFENMVLNWHAHKPLCCFSHVSFCPVTRKCELSPTLPFLSWFLYYPKFLPADHLASHLLSCRYLVWLI